MQIVWTAILACAVCAERFTLNRLSIARVLSAKSIVPCPHCRKKPAAGNAHRVVSLAAANRPFRKVGGGIWHYSPYCSQWPGDDFIELDFPPQAEICNECRVLVST